jgi:hypothetical protein
MFPRGLDTNWLRENVKYFSKTAKLFGTAKKANKAVFSGFADVT